MKSVYSKVLNRGEIPQGFLQEMIDWAKHAPEILFAVNGNPDIYSKVLPELGPWTGIRHRTAVMLEVLRVLAGFESSWTWTEGVDTSRAGADNDENSEAGAWQVSYDSRKLDPSLKELLANRGISSGLAFQRVMKSDHRFAMLYEVTLLRHNTKHNGPLYKGEERKVIRESLRGDNHSIYPWLSRKAVAEFEEALG